MIRLRLQLVGGGVAKNHGCDCLMRRDRMMPLKDVAVGLVLV